MTKMATHFTEQGNVPTAKATLLHAPMTDRYSSHAKLCSLSNSFRISTVKHKPKQSVRSTSYSFPWDNGVRYYLEGIKHCEGTQLYDNNQRPGGVMQVFFLHLKVDCFPITAHRNLFKPFNTQQQFANTNMFKMYMNSPNDKRIQLCPMAYLDSNAMSQILNA